MKECMWPVTVKNKKGITQRVRCGKCAPCLAFTRNEKFIRLREHMKDYDYTTFITLTYSDENLVYAINPTLSVRDVQLFMKRLRKNLNGLPISYYLIGEYGTRYKRPHYHLLLFGLSKKAVMKFVPRAWDLGHVHVGTVNDRSINYVCKYHVLRNRNVPEGSQKPFLLTSKEIGIRYVEKMAQWHKERLQDGYFYQFYDIKLPLPRYYKEKIFSEQDKELICRSLEEKYKDKKVFNNGTRKEMLRELEKNKRICNKFGFKITDNDLF